MVIFDTTILIEISRGNDEVKKKVVEMSPTFIYASSITVAEFIVGARDKSDMLKIKRHLDNYTFLSINEGINTIFLELFTSYSLSHRPGIADMLIAATALYYELPVYTLNKKHFAFIPGIQLV
jgi:tRNA(fMet)-specific endonuclease VapC